MSDPIGTLFSTPQMLGLFSAEAHVQQILHFEAALARAEAQAGIIPQSAAESIAAACRVERFDVPGLYREAVTAGTVVIPLVRELSRQAGDEAGKYAHWGATSQDAIDTATMLQMREGLDLLTSVLLDICASCARLAEEHRDTLMPGRTLLQQALPITFGLKAARWLSLVTRQVEGVREVRSHSIALQFGGAAGTLAALGPAGTNVAASLATELGLPLPDLPWHAERDRVARIASALGVAAGAMLKIAGDILLMSQPEVGEVSEGAAPGKGGSSAMPHKHNPVDATMARAAARQAIGAIPLVLGAMDAEHERAAGSWQLEWQVIPLLFCFVAAAVARVKNALSGLHIDAKRMRANVDSGQGLLMTESAVMALALHLGRPEAQRLIKAASERVASEKITLRQALTEDEVIGSTLSAAEIERALNPESYLGSTDVWIDHALEAYGRLREDIG
ncbi:MAG: 3-carboxy-cis,cis-muconate cycloisomerase [Chloroflexia bacterium]